MASCTETLDEAEARIRAEAETALAAAREQVEQMGGTDDMRALLMLGYKNSIAIQQTIALHEARAKHDPVAAMFALADPAP